jgi:aryl-alcohol dehydrogenase-like predicted oxidoreductase
LRACRPITSPSARSSSIGQFYALAGRSATAAPDRAQIDRIVQSCDAIGLGESAWAGLTDGMCDSEFITIADDLRVRRIGYGAMKLTGDQVWGPYPDRERGAAVLRGAVEAGITLIDTADVYGPHTNELLIRLALHPYPDGLVIATKGGFVRGGFGYDTLGAVGNVNYLKQSAQLSARRLGVEAIDLYYLHSGRATDAPFVDQVGALAELREAGLIRSVGLSNVTLEQLRIAQRIVPIAAVTALYNLTARVGADLRAAAEQDGIAFVPWHPVTVTDGPRAERAAQVVAPIAAAHEATIQQVALAWQLRGSPQSIPIPGTTSIEHLRQNLAAESLVLSEVEMRSLDGIASE